MKLKRRSRSDYMEEVEHLNDIKELTRDSNLFTFDSDGITTKIQKKNQSLSRSHNKNKNKKFVPTGEVQRVRHILLKKNRENTMKNEKLHKKSHSIDRGVFDAWDELVPIDSLKNRKRIFSVPNLFPSLPLPHPGQSVFPAPDKRHHLLIASCAVFRKNFGSHASKVESIPCSTDVLTLTSDKEFSMNVDEEKLKELNVKSLLSIEPHNEIFTDDVENDEFITTIARPVSRKKTKKDRRREAVRQKRENLIHSKRLQNKRMMDIARYHGKKSTKEREERKEALHQYKLKLKASRIRDELLGHGVRKLRHGKHAIKDDGDTVNLSNSIDGSLRKLKGESFNLVRELMGNVYKRGMIDR